MKISVAMATYNGEDYIEEQLFSIINQTRPPDEIVICDDNSSDNTLEIIDKITSNTIVPIVAYKNEKNLGFTGNFIKAISLSNGDLIFISDQDDVWFENKISAVIDLYRRNPGKHVFINDTIFVDKNLNKTGFTKLQTINKLYKSNAQFVAGCCTTITGNFIKPFIPIPSGYSYDEWIHYIGTLTESRLVYDVPLQLYRRHGSNTSNVEFNMNKKFIYSNYFFTIIKKLYKFDLEKKINFLTRQLHATLLIQKVFMQSSLVDNFDNFTHLDTKIKKKVYYTNNKLKFYKFLYKFFILKNIFKY